MPTLKDTLIGWRDRAEIDWFGQFVRAWIPFNAWLTHTFGDLTDAQLLEELKKGGNSVSNGILPLLTQRLPMARGGSTGWQDESAEAHEFRQQCGELHQLLQTRVVASRRGRLTFEAVDIGWNAHKDEKQRSHGRDFRVRRDHPGGGQCLLEVTASKSNPAVAIALTSYDWTQVEVDAAFQALELGHRSRLKIMFETISPRIVVNVLQPPGTPGGLICGNAIFIPEPRKVFSALVDVIYGLRNALFHGSLTPSDQNIKLYEPAYHLVMRLVRCTI